MTPAAVRTGIIALIAALASGCATRDLVVVIPDRGDGHIGAVTVEAGSGKTVLDKAYSAAQPRRGAVNAFTSDAGRVNRTFEQALKALPTPPKNYRLYFENDSTVLMASSRAAFEQVFTEIAARAVAEIVVTGHTDTVGTVEDKDQLSMDRAKAVAELFVQRGIPRKSITIAGRGSRELLIHTDDQVPEPRNRRVEITVR